MKKIKGITGAPGITYSKVLYYEKSAGGKKIGFDEAVIKALEKVQRLHDKALRELGEDKAKIFEAYEMLLSDDVLMNQIKEKILSGSEAEAAIRSVTEKMAAILASKKNEYMRQRADDIRYVGNILTDTVNGAGFDFPAGDDKYIIAAEELTPVDTMLFDKNRLSGLATKKGGGASHTVILAK